MLGAEGRWENGGGEVTRMRAFASIRNERDEAHRLHGAEIARLLERSSIPPTQHRPQSSTRSSPPRVGKRARARGSLATASVLASIET
eukprot:4569274-Prymnesium_polylepis.2